MLGRAGFPGDERVAGDHRVSVVELLQYPAFGLGQLRHGVRAPVDGPLERCAEMRRALEAGIGCFNVESEAEAERVLADDIEMHVRQAFDDGSAHFHWDKAMGSLLEVVAVVADVVGLAEAPDGRFAFANDAAVRMSPMTTR